MRTPIEHVAAAIVMYYEGRSLNDIPRLMYQQHSVYTTPASVYKWITRFSKIAINETDKIKVAVGDTWIVSENMVKIVGKSYWLLDITDINTRFLLATMLSYGRATGDIRHLLEIARDKAGKIPKRILTNDWVGYPDGIELAYGADVKHVRTLKLDNDPDSARLIESWHNTLKDRMRIMFNLKDRDHSQLILDGWLVHYNYFRLQKALSDSTPAEIAKANFRFHSWFDLVNHSKYKAGVIKTEEPTIQSDTSNNHLRGIAFRIKDTQLSNLPLLVSLPRGADDSVFPRRKPKGSKLIRIVKKAVSLQ
jgi:transposase-like protein